MTDISQALRELLLARAAGQIDGEEFERRQAALHAELLTETPSATKLTSAAAGKTTWWPWALGIVIVGAAAGLYAWLGNPGAASVSAPTPMSATPLATAPMTAGGMPEKAGSGGDLKVMANRLAEKLAKATGFPVGKVGKMLIAGLNLTSLNADVELSEDNKIILRFKREVKAKKNESSPDA